MPSSSAHVALVASMVVLLQHGNVMAKLVIPGMKSADADAMPKDLYHGPELSDLPEELEFLVQDTTEDPGTLTGAVPSNKISKKSNGMHGKVTEGLRKSLVSELIGTFREGASQDRLVKWKASMATMFAALPKNEHGNLGHAAAKYVLHRTFVQKHSWSMSGLEPTDAHWNASSPLGTLNKWVPEYLLGSIEKLLGTQGINLHEMSVLAALFEDLAHKEATQRLREIFEVLGLSSDESISEAMAKHVIKIYMTIYASVSGDYAKSVKDVVESGLSIDGDTEAWLEEVQSNMSNLAQQDASQVDTSEKSEFSFATITSVVEEIGERFGSFNDRECRALKSTLLGMENRWNLGRVALSDFYKKGMNQSYWNFNEKVEYLRVLGALDETDPAKTQLIIPNYISSKSNCLVPSNLYAVCCQNECENLLGHLEDKIKAPVAAPKEIAQLAARLSSDTVTAPRELSSALLAQLQDVAQAHAGKVPLHSQMFAKWMHYAFPRECPYPHDTNENPQTPDEWMKESGSMRASTEEMLEHIQKGAERPRVTLGWNREEPVELPRNAAEHQINGEPSEPNISLMFKRSSDRPNTGPRWLQGSRLVIMAAVFVLVLVLSALAWTSHQTGYLKKNDSDLPGMDAPHDHSWSPQNYALHTVTASLKRRRNNDASLDSCQIGV
jgi:hypothetical protein